MSGRLFLRIVLVTIALPAVVPAKSMSEDAKGDDWEAAHRLLKMGRVSEGLEVAARFALSFPQDPRIGTLFVDYRLSGRARTPKEWDARQKEYRRILDSLATAYHAQPSPHIALNFVRLATDMYKYEILRRRIGSDELCQKVLEFADSAACTWELYTEIGDYCLYVRENEEQFLAMLRRAEAVALARKGRGSAQLGLASIVGAEDVGSALLKISIDRARGLLHGKRDRLRAKPDLHRIVQLDSLFGYHSNWALNQLGLIALGEDDVERAGTYLALAARVRPDGILRTFGYSKELALEMIRRGRFEVAIRYLEVAHRVEGTPNERTVYGLAIGYTRAGDTGRAARWLTKYLELPRKPDEALVRNLLDRIRNQSSGDKEGDRSSR